jgi:hypothetical protein
VITINDAPLPIGSFFLRQVEGMTGRLISAGQAFIGDPSKWTHAGIILADGELIQGEPGGAKIYPQEILDDHRPLLVSDAPVQVYMDRLQQTMTFGPTIARQETIIRQTIDNRARMLKGTPYSYLDYLAIGAVTFHWPGYKHLEDYVESSKHLICSALVDRGYSWAGVHLFDDKRLPGMVKPGDLAAYADRHAGMEILRNVEKAGGPQ